MAVFRCEHLSQVLIFITELRVLILITEHQQKHGTFSRFKLDVRRTSFKPVPFPDTSLITSSHIFHSISTGFSDGKGREKKIIF